MSYINNIVGQPVEGEDFFDRENDVDSIWEDLQQGNSILLLAPRRVGKTSLALRVGERAVEEGWKFAFVDVERDRDELSLFANLFEILKSAGLKVPLLAHLIQGIATARRNLSGRFEGGGLAIEIKSGTDQESSTLETQVDRLFNELEASDQKVLIAMDELPVFLTELQREEGDETQRLRRFLNWFRALRLRHRKNVRWLLLGSVGLDTFAESRRLTPTINDLQTASLGAYDDEIAIQFLKELGQSKRFEMSDEVCRTVLEKIGWPLPFYLQLVFHRLYSSLRGTQRQPEVQDVEAAVDKLAAPEFYKHFEPWRGRLKEGLGDDESEAAIAILNLLCQFPDGQKRDRLLDAVAGEFPQKDGSEIRQILSTVLGQLERDGYLLRAGNAETGHQYAFRSFLLRQYWYTREIL